MTDHYDALKSMIEREVGKDLSAGGPNGDWWWHLWGLESERRALAERVKMLEYRLQAIGVLSDVKE